MDCFAALAMTNEKRRGRHGASAVRLHHGKPEFNGALYAGVTSNLSARVFQHREGLTPGFTSRYDCKSLVLYEPYERMDEAMAREEQINGGSRKKKIALIEAMNPQWTDLYESLA